MMPWHLQQNGPAKVVCLTCRDVACPGTFALREVALAAFKKGRPWPRGSAVFVPNVSSHSRDSLRRPDP